MFKGLHISETSECRGKDAAVGRLQPPASPFSSSNRPIQKQVSFSGDFMLSISAVVKLFNLWGFSKVCSDFLSMKRSELTLNDIYGGSKYTILDYLNKVMEKCT